MTMWHLNPKGYPEECEAKNFCPFGNLITYHFGNEEEASRELESLKEVSLGVGSKRLSLIDDARGLNDIAWSKVLEETTILSDIQERGFAEITPTEFKRITNREPRLAFNFTNSSELPRPLIRENLRILSLSKSKYLLAPYKAYFNLGEGNYKRNTQKLVSPPALRSIDIHKIPNEVQAIKLAYGCNMIQEVVGEEGLIPVLSGRQGGGHFTYKVALDNGKELVVNSENPQIEVDDGYEGSNQLVIIEAKKNNPSDFLIRQLYLPYRWALEKQKKRSNPLTITPVFFNYFEGNFDFYLCNFEDPENLSSLKIEESFSFRFR